MPSDYPQEMALPPELNPRGYRPARPPRGPLARVLSVLAVVMSFSVLLASGAGYALYRRYDGNINRLTGLFDRDEDRPAKGPGKALNFLLVGSDSREGLDPDDRSRLTTGTAAGKRTDTIILIHLSANRDKALLVSFPRDSFVPIPGHGTDRINAAFSLGGPRLTIKTVEQLTKVRIDHYLEVDFLGFERMVEALDGVEVCLPERQKEAKSGIDLEAGTHTVRGKQALAFVRQRNGVRGGDLGRIQRQQQFLGSMLRKAMSAGILARPDRLFRFLDVATKSIQADDGLRAGDLRDLAMSLRGLDPAKVTFVTVPVDRIATREGKSVVLLDEPRARELYESIRNDGRIPGPAASAPPPRLIVPPSRIRVRVLNGAGIQGLATRATADLRRVGFLISGSPGNADATTYEDTVVRFGPSREDSAQTLAAAVPGATLQPDASLGRTLELVVGRKYAGTREVSVGPAVGSRGSGAQPSSGIPRPPPTTASEDPCAAG